MWFIGVEVEQETSAPASKKNPGSAPDVQPPIHVSRGEILKFKHTRVSAVNRMATRTFREKKYNKNKADSFFQLNFNVCINVDNRERARARDEKTKETNFVGRKT